MFEVESDEGEPAATNNSEYGPDDESWKLEGACKDRPAAEFFPANGEGVAKAKTLCKVCAVRTECLEYALAHGIEHGVWGGTSARERRRLRQQRQLGQTVMDTAATD
ncbi:WhiB family transcriptional regulator [Candidatus Microgenomates bacterium]|nr:WhiB family transcriptional regulator [Candidatus Microgenomates bacterium]